MNQAAKNHRNSLLARVHCLKRDLGMDDETYRDALEGAFGVRSAGSLKVWQLIHFADGLGRQLPKPEPKDYPGRPKNMGPMRPAPAKHDARYTNPRAAQLQKIEAYLTEAGREWAYADALARRICKADSIAWVKDRDLYKIITALKKDAERHGREPE